MVLLDTTVVNVALPWMGRDLGAGIDGLQWTVSGYLLTLSALILLGGSLGDRFGRTDVVDHQPLAAGDGAAARENDPAQKMIATESELPIARSVKLLRMMFSLSGLIAVAF